MGIKDVLKRLLSKDELMQEESHRRKIERILNQREKNSNERELERYLEEERQKEIKRQLEIFRKRDARDFWHHSPNLQRGSPILRNDRPILKQKKIFHMKSNNLKTNRLSERMFF